VYKVDLDRREIDFRLVDEQKSGPDKQDSRRGKPKPRRRKTR
jgi:hypothetical protein